MNAILPSYLRNNPAILLLLGLQIICGYLAVRYSEVLVIAPLMALIIAVAFCLPNLGLLLLAVSWFFPIALSETMGIYPADFILMAVVGGCIARSLVEGQSPIERTPLNLWIVLWLGAMALSVFQATDLPMAVKNWLRHGQMFLLYFAIVKFMRPQDVRRAISLFVSICMVMSLWNIMTFVRAGGNVRAFGPASVLMSGFLALVGTLVAARVLFSAEARDRFYWGAGLCIIVAGQMANQSRGAMIQMVSGIIFVGWHAYRWSRFHQRPAMRRRIATLAGLAVVGLLVVYLLVSPLVSKVLTRYATQEGNPLATAQMRIFLWTSALRIFGEHPLLGVGPAQDHVLVEILPGMRFSPWFAHTQGLGFHNSVVGYLAETGIVGSILLAILLIVALRMGRGIVPAMKDEKEAMWAVGIWGAVFVIISRYLYEGHLFYSISGMTTVTFFAFLFVIWNRRASLLSVH